MLGPRCSLAARSLFHLLLLTAATGAFASPEVAPDVRDASLLVDASDTANENDQFLLVKQQATQQQPPSTTTTDTSISDFSEFKHLQSIIPSNYKGTFEDIFFKGVANYTTTPLPPPTVVYVDDGTYTGTNVVPYITVPSYIVVESGSSTGQKHYKNGVSGLELETSIDNNVEETPSTTLFTQVSMDRIHLLHQIIWRWQGPVSAAIYIDSPTDLPLLTIELNRLKSSSVIAPPQSGPLIISLLFGVEFLRILKYPTFEASKATEKIYHPYDLLYPINTLRNLALSQCRTPLGFSMDTDFVPSDNLLGHLWKHQHALMETLLDPKRETVAVIPAFEVEPTSSLVIKSFTSLTKKYLTSKCLTMEIIPFHSQLRSLSKSDRSLMKKWCTGQPIPPHSTMPLKITEVQGATDFHTWFGSKKPYTVISPSSKKKVNRYFEPYIIAHRSILPLFDPKFKGYAFNKRSQSIEMQYKGLEFMVAPEVYVVHRPHGSSESKEKLVGGGVVKGTVGRVYQQFLQEVKVKYGAS
ncbi:hypothetical protein HDV05_001043 [Chytridiales sp. JEL 0842]|nr:hypothetical protein HDV05_001043 [Chytridiales sp. JEL 0842]